MAGLRRRPGLFLALALVGAVSLLAVAASHLHSSDNNAQLPGMQMPRFFEGMEDCPSVHDGRTDGSKDGGAGCDFHAGNEQHERLRKLTEVTKDTMRIAMKHRDSHHLHKTQSRMESLKQALWRDDSRVQGIKTKTTSQLLSTESKSMAAGSSPSPSLLFVGDKDSPPPFQPPVAASPAPSGSPSPSTPGSLHGNVESGVTLGSGEYFMDVLIGSPPRHFSLIIDTGSDLTWAQCNPCKDCYEQDGPKFDPSSSSSYKPLSCSDSQCQLVYSRNENSCLPHDPHGCNYFYWYGDRSNTTGDLALETFTLNVTDGKPFHVDNIVFGCGHTNEGLFRGAGGLLGLGKGPLSFASQLHERYGRKFSYCLVDRDNNMSVSSVLTFGEDKALAAHSDLQYTSFAKNTSVETFYYVEIEKVSVGGEELPIPASAWEIDAKGSGGTIIDSGTTLTYFATPAYQAIKKAFESQISYPRAEANILDLCYDLSGISQAKFPDFAIAFKDGAVFKPPTENFFIEMSPEQTVCLAILEAPSSSLSILGNFLQQNIHILYDIEKSRLGFAPMACADV